MCVHFRYGCQISSLEAFPGSRLGILPYLPQRSVRITSSPSDTRICLDISYLACPGSSIRRSCLPAPSLHSLHLISTGISTCCPSTTPLGLALGPDLPRADEPSSGNLGSSVRGILTHVPLLTPAFSLPAAPHVLTVMLPR